MIAQSRIELRKWARLLAIGITIVTSYGGADAQPSKIHRIGYLSPRRDYRDKAFRQGLSELGYFDGKNIFIEFRYAKKTEELPDLAAELVRLNVAVIVTTGTPPTLAAKQASTTIPIVMIGSGDPVASGLVASLARPGGNITGSSALSPELAGKRLEILQEAFPKISRVAALWNPNNPASAVAFKATEVAGKAMGLQIESVQFRNLSDLSDSLLKIVKKADALVFFRGNISVTTNQIVDVATKSRLPAIYPEPEFSDAGGLMSYGTNNTELYRRAAAYVDKILKGAKPADLPVEQPKKFEFIVNLKTAKQIGLTIPPNVLARADRVIK
jgi:putative ABC transport system substrate-binding protein